MIIALIFVLFAFWPAGCSPQNEAVAGDGGEDYDMTDGPSAEWLDSAGGMWAKSYSTGTSKSITSAVGGGFVVAGSLFTSGQGTGDILILRLDDWGDVLWRKLYGGPDNDWPNDVQRVSDDGYVVVGKTSSFGAGWGDMWILRLDGIGNVLWQKAYGGDGGDDVGHAIREVSGGFIVAGGTQSFGSGAEDSWVVKIDAGGNVIWEKTYGVEELDYARDIQQTMDGGYIVAGEVNLGMGNYRARVLKLDAEGNLVWQRSFGMAGGNVTMAVRQISDGNYVVTGPSDFLGPGNTDIWITKLDQNGSVVWQKRFDGGGEDSANSVLETSGGSIVVGGTTFGQGAGSHDFWILELDGNANVVWQKTYGGPEYEGLTGILKADNGGLVAVGDTESFGAEDWAVWVVKLDSGGEIDGGCPAGITGNTSAAPVDVLLPDEDYPVSVQATHATVTETEVIPVDINITVGTQCGN